MRPKWQAPAGQKCRRLPGRGRARRGEFDVDGEWRQVEFRWSDFGGSDGSDVRGLAIVGGPAPGQFELWIDQLEFR